MSVRRAALTLVLVAVIGAATWWANPRYPVKHHTPTPRPETTWSTAPVRHVPGEPAWTHTCTGTVDDYNCPDAPSAAQGK